MADSFQNQSQMATGAMQRPVPVQQGRTMTTLHESSSGSDSPNSTSSSMSGRERRRLGKLKQQQRLDAARGRIHALEAQVACLRAIIAQLQERAHKDGHDMVTNTGNAVTFDLYASEVNDASIQTDISVCHSYPDIFVSAQQVALSSGGDAAAGAVMPAGVGSTGCKDFISHSLAHVGASQVSASKQLHDCGFQDLAKHSGPLPTHHPNQIGQDSGEGASSTTPGGISSAFTGGEAVASPAPGLCESLPRGASTVLLDAGTLQNVDFNSQTLANMSRAATQAAASVSVHEACTPGSSNPGAQNGAAVSCLYNAGNKVSSYCEGHYDTGKTACAERQCGHGATARHYIGDIAVQFGPSVSGATQCEEQDAQPVLFDAIGDYMSEEPVENLKDFNSQHLDKLALSSHGPLPPEVIADFNSQGIAHTVSKCDFSSCTPGSSNPGAQNGAEDFRLYNAGLKVSSYSEGQYDTGKTACAGDIAVQYGPLRLGDSQDAQPVLFDAIGGGISEEHGGNLKDFNSQESPDFDSQDLAAHRCGPLPSNDANADARNGAEELVWKLEALLERLYREQHDFAIPVVLEQLQSARSRLNDFNSGSHLKDLD